jgi:putative two-component system response regulator
MSTVVAFPLPAGEAPLPAALRRRLEEHEVAERSLERVIKRNMVATVQALAATIELRDPYTAHHQRRVAGLATGIGRLLGLTSAELCGLELAATIHDIGKLSVPTEILAKPGPITAAEFELIKGHATAGADVLRGIDFPWPVRETVWQHHERMDGSGYPRGLRGGQILAEARILAVADVTDAMASHRPYRTARGLDAALDEIESGSGTRYDADVARACTKLFREVGHRLPD